MRPILILTCLVLSSVAATARGGHGGSGTGSSGASHAVSGYTNAHGTSVAPYHATNPNNTQRDNYGTRGNLNPYTGAVGTRGADH